MRDHDLSTATRVAILATDLFHMLREEGFTRSQAEELMHEAVTRNWQTDDPVAETTNMLWMCEVQRKARLDKENSGPTDLALDFFARLTDAATETRMRVLRHMR